ncbi:heme-binding protein 2 [Oryzias latipes]|uniref:Heme-binding protein soul2 n=1 Tax=Oryzias latipes TaxID=8090 RepID=A0A3B3H8I6_ORYLA|nr:heme-binding protein 2 [Oryzias latipes]
MELQLLLVVLVLLPSCGGHFLEHCHGQPCPDYYVLEANEDFEVRQYPPTDWISTIVEGPDLSAFMAARSRLVDFCGKLPGSDQVCQDTWPAIFTISEMTDGQKVTLSWFIPPGTNIEMSDSSVTVEHRPPAIVFASSFSGFPAVGNSQEHMDVLRKSLTKAGKIFNPHKYIGASYDGFLALSHYNEVWMFAV